MKTLTPRSVTIAHTCGHITTVAVDCTTIAWTKAFEKQPCFQCQPTLEVTRLCGHTEVLRRYFTSPRRFEIAAMQLCTACQMEATCELEAVSPSHNH